MLPRPLTAGQGPLFLHLRYFWSVLQTAQVRERWISGGGAYLAVRNGRPFGRGVDDACLGVLLRTHVIFGHIPFETYKDHTARILGT